MPQGMEALVAPHTTTRPRTRAGRLVSAMTGPVLLSPEELIVLRALAASVTASSRRDASTWAWPHTIAARTPQFRGMGAAGRLPAMGERTVRRHLNALHASGLAARHRSHQSGHRFRMVQAGYEYLDERMMSP